MKELKIYLIKLFNISEADWEIFSSKLVNREFSKNKIVLDINKKENYLSFIEKGMLRKYIPQEFNEITFEFAFAGNFVSAYDYFITQQESTYIIETITNTVLWSISYENLQKVYEQTSLGNTIGRLACEDQFIKKSKREIALISLSPEEHYLSLFKEQPQLLSLLPLKYIASYLGITPQALSRIRKRIS
jgi:CRP-like cAMP-binding protein